MRDRTRAAWHLTGVVLAYVVLLLLPGAQASPMQDPRGAGNAPSQSTLEIPLDADASTVELTSTLAAELKRGSWRRACAIATAALGRGEQNIDALGVFGMCVALRNDQTATATTLKRLREAEPAPYYSSLTLGIQQLRGGAPERAESTFGQVVQERQGDPLALYFTGEAQHQLKRNTQAIASFKAVLKRWPEYTPALGAAARLLASPEATAQDLKEAVSLTERATAIEPMNRDYWVQLAELYERTGQRDRAAAVKLQWLNRPAVK